MPPLRLASLAGSSARLPSAPPLAEALVALRALPAVRRASIRLRVLQWIVMMGSLARGIPLLSILARKVCLLLISQMGWLLLVRRELEMYVLLAVPSRKRTFHALTSRKGKV